MENLNAATVADSAVRLGLLSQEQVLECWQEINRQTASAHEFFRHMERKGWLTPWQSRKLLKGDTQGFFLGGYCIQYKIASGSFGRVFRAGDPRSGRTVALKVLRRKWTEKKHAIELFEREGRTGTTLHHPNIVEVLGVGYDAPSNQYFLVMEFVEGGNLRNFIDTRKKMAPAEALRFLEECTAGLAFAFSQGVTHRDMKASNILISSQGRAKLVDFGLAGVKSNSYIPLDESVDRTVDYAGLELATGVPKGDTRSDIFFLGCIMYQMLTGTFPLEMGRSARARMASERFTRLKPLKLEEVKCASVIRLVDNMMSLDPERRFQTPSQLLEAVREVRREVQSAEQPGGLKSQPNTVFIVEKDEPLQDIFRGKFKEKGLRVLLAADPARAVDRFRQQPFDLLIVDAGTTGEPGLLVFERLFRDAELQGVPLAGVLMLNEDQTDWQEQITPGEKQVVLVQPIKLKQLLGAVQELLGKREE